MRWLGLALVIALEAGVVPPSIAQSQRDHATASFARANRRVDEFITRAADPRHPDRAVIEAGLQRLLGTRSLDRPEAFVSGPRGQHRLAVVYTFVTDSSVAVPGTAVALRMFIERGGRFVFGDAARTDMDGYADVSVTEMPPPNNRETWFLLAGQLAGANGPNTRMRIYAFDGARFRPIWMPENAWGHFVVTPRDGGFSVTGDYYRGRARDDEYRIGEDGVYRVDR